MIIKVGSQNLMKVFIVFSLLFVSIFCHSQAKCEDTLNNVTKETPSIVSAMGRLIERWKKTPLPDFLRNKQEDSRAEIELIFEAEDINQILISDQRKPLNPFSNLIHPEFSSLQHQTNFDQLISKLKRGFLRPHANTDENSKFGIYLELYKKSEPKPFHWANVELHFDFHLLDRLDYHINPGWDYGHYSPISASPIVNPGRVAHYLQNVLIHRPGNEIIFDEPIFFSSLKKIIVEKGKKQILLRQIEIENISCPTPVGWNNLIDEQ